MSLKVLLVLLVCCHQLDGRFLSVFAPRRPVTFIPPPGYYHQQRQAKAGLQSDHQQAQGGKADGKNQKGVAKQVKFDDDPMMNAGMYQGDIIGPLPDEVKPFIMSNFIWTNGIIPFEISSELESQQEEIAQGMAEIESKTCIRFKPREKEVDYVSIFYGKGCSSSVGRRGGRQTLSLGRGCHSHGIIVHELMHAVGFYHLHQRYDRDDYLNVHWENIQPTTIGNFKRMAPDDLRVDAVFDYASVMLYGDTTFSRDKISKTMTPTVYGVRLIPPAQKYGLSEVDVMSINRLYRCDNFIPRLPFNK